ncbi:MAG TPA: hypothetical protein VL754_06435 [Verrucomicrobiae bacterium]|jgi:predicted outer membrane repeat protein|nr:hypothetical protein [Verrucomicrobiae bacterium]
MNYFQPLVLGCDETIVAAWDSQVSEMSNVPAVRALIDREGAQLFPRFASSYARLRALPRGTRRAIERRLRRRCARRGAPEWQPRLAATLAGAALLLALGQGASEAATINVTAKAPPGIVDGDGKCSLAEAIVNANDGGATYADCEAGSGSGDTIVLPKGTISLTAVDNDDFGDTGLPVINTSITIQGNNAKIARSKNAPGFRLIAVSASGDLTLENVTLTGGDGLGRTRGGAITSYGNVSIIDSIISGNTAFEGGAVFIENGSLTITNSVITKNVANYGGGITNYSGVMTMTNSTVSKNKALLYHGNPSFGGGLLSTTAQNTITGSLITGNSASKGGGLAVYGATVVSNSTISKNSATDKGGGIYNGDALTVNNGTISGNKADTGGGVSNRGAFTLNGGTITKNTAASYGGGVDTSGGGVFTNNGTVSGNKAPVGADTYT